MHPPMRADACAAEADWVGALDHARATTARDVARRATEAGARDGFRHGVRVVLDPCEPDHAATVAAWRERRAVAAGEGT